MHRTYNIKIRNVVICKLYNLTSDTLLCLLSVGYGEVGGVLSQVQTGIFPFLYYPVDDKNYFLWGKNARQKRRLITLSKIQRSEAPYRTRKRKCISCLFAYRSSERDACRNIYALSYFAIGPISNTNALNWPEPGIFQFHGHNTGMCFSFYEGKLWGSPST
jgi:hypothetical protein